MSFSEKFQEISCLIPSKWGSSCKSPRETKFLSKSTWSTLWKTCLFQTSFMKQHAWSVQISHLLSCQCYASSCVFWVPPAQTQLNRDASRDHMPIQSIPIQICMCKCSGNNFLTKSKPGLVTIIPSQCYVSSGVWTLSCVDGWRISLGVLCSGMSLAFSWVVKTWAMLC